MPAVHCCSEVALAHLMPLSVYSASSLQRDEVVSACKVGTHELWLEPWRMMLGIHLLSSDSVKRHLRGRHLSVLNLKFDFISDGGCTREEQIALSLKRHLFPRGSREPKAFWICFSRVHPPSEIKSNYKFKTLKGHLLKRHLTLSDFWGQCAYNALLQ